MTTRLGGYLEVTVTENGGYNRRATNRSYCII